ncbi:MAG: leucyl/phenylalanyl-tRNA--protein transferase [Bacteroidota bacterium]
MFTLNHKINFPHPDLADDDGLLAVGGDLSTERILFAYKNGIFPWYEDGQPILWWSPNPRMILFPEKLHTSKNMKKLFKKNIFNVTYNQSFEQVINNCANSTRKGQYGTWITDEMISAYIELHNLGKAYSVEVWQADELVGGLYGIYLKELGVFCGESMFTKVSDASKYGFIWWVNKLKSWNVRFIDCQVYTSHLASMGAEEISRTAFLKLLKPV